VSRWWSFSRRPLSQSDRLVIRVSRDLVRERQIWDDLTEEALDAMGVPAGWRAGCVAGLRIAVEIVEKTSRRNGRPDNE
jgi:hypothetical protein